MSSAGRETVVIERLNSESFSEFGDVIEPGDRPMMINEGMCERHGDLARVAFDPAGRAGISVFDARIRSLPYEFSLMERHPFGSQAFLPMGAGTFLVIVAADTGQKPGRPRAFETAPRQGVNILRGVWHGVLTPLSGSGLFGVVDWIGEAENLELFEFSRGFRVVRPASVGRPEHS